MFIRNEIVETEESLREFVAPNPISCGRFLNPKSEGLPKSLVGLNSLLLEVRSGILTNIQLLIVSNNNSIRNLGEMSVYLSYCLVWSGTGDDRFLFEYSLECRGSFVIEA